MGGGHFFEYDEKALERLRGLTTELRLGTRRDDGESWSGNEHEEEGEEVDDVDADDEEEKGESGDEGDEKESRGVGREKREMGRAVPWFE